MRAPWEATLRRQHHHLVPLPLRKFFRNTRSEHLRRTERSIRCFFPPSLNLESLIMRVHVTALMW
jgi:hypothetical protein